MSVHFMFDFFFDQSNRYCGKSIYKHGGYYDNSYVYGKKIYIKMKWYLLLCDHFLYYNLPKILLPKGAILHFKLTWKLWHVFVMNSASGDEDEAPTTDEPKQTNFLSNFQVYLKRRIAPFGKRILGKL